VLTGRCYSVEMDKHKILVDAKAELERHVPVLRHSECQCWVGSSVLDFAETSTGHVVDEATDSDTPGNPGMSAELL